VRIDINIHIIRYTPTRHSSWPSSDTRTILYIFESKVVAMGFAIEHFWSRVFNYSLTILIE